MTTSRHVPAVATGLLLACIGARTAAGPITPPPGPVTSTHKTLSEVEPRTAINATNTPGDADSLFKITQPGSYYLTGNITGVVGKHGIEITASGVTLDLNGFDLVGIPGMGAFDGVSVTAPSHTNIAVLNGSVRNWGDEGIDLGSSDAINCRVDSVRASGNGGNGIVTGSGSTVSKCSAYQNIGVGISTTGNGCTITDCTAYQNGGDGINTANGCTLSNCTSHTNAGMGIRAANGSTVAHCTSHTNSGDGINVGSGSTVTDCSVRNNIGDGIECFAICVIRGNVCSNSGNGSGDGAGIHVLSDDNLIEGNNCGGGDRGIDVDFAGNVIIRNFCTDNTINWTIAANNVVGPILDRTTPGSAAISGNSAPSSLGTTDPNANFTY